MAELPASSAPPEDLIAVARIARPQGIRGEVIADLLTDFPDRFAKLDEVRLARPDGELEIVRLEKSWPHQRRIVLKFKGYDSRDAVESLRDTRVLVTRAQLVPLPADTFYDFDLVECAVVTAGGQPVGKVKAVQNFGAAPLLVVNAEDGREILIPLTHSICPVVDVPQKRIVIEPPEGLLDL
jgi:16S rRNA processing protein RimM